MRAPILDDHFHVNRLTGKGPGVLKEFMRSGGTHIVLVSLPSWCCGVTPVCMDDFRPVFDTTLADAQAIRDLGCGCYVIAGIHPAEIGRFLEWMSADEAESLMKGGLDIAAEYVREGKCIGLKSGRPHYPVPPEIWDLSNRVLFHALSLAGKLDCALQIHAESGSCEDVVSLAEKAGSNPRRVVKHFATCETPLHPSVTAREEFLPEWFAQKRDFTLESDYMDDPSRPGAVNGPRSIPRKMQNYLQHDIITEDDLWHVCSAVPEKIYGVEFQL